MYGENLALNCWCEACSDGEDGSIKLTLAHLLMGLMASKAEPALTKCVQC